MTAPELSAKLLNGFDPVAAEIEIRRHITALANDSGEPDWWVLLALALTKQKRFILAEETCRFALSLSHGHKDGQYLLSQILAGRDQIRATSYWRGFQVARQHYREYPQYVAIETVGRCNAACSFCPNGVLERRHSAMDNDLFCKIVGDLSQVPHDHPFTITPSLVNEPLMDPKLFERCRHINETLPQASLTFFTNLNFLPPLFFENLSTLRNVRYWNVSFNAAAPDEYLQVMGIPFDRTVANINSMLRFLRDHPGCKSPLRLSRVGDGSARDGEFLRKCASLFPEFEEGRDFVAQCRPRADWLGRVDTARTPVPCGLPCNAWLSLYIFCDGRVPHCCMDAHGDYAIGDVRTQSVLEIYNCTGFRSLRENHSAREGIDPCNRCPLIQ